MEQSRDVQALEQIFTEVDETQIKIILSTQSIKAQTALTREIKRRIQHQKQILNLKRSNNLKSETELKLHVQNYNSLINAQDDLHSAIAELKKNFLIVKEYELTTTEQTKAGEKRYDDKWLKHKKGYENLPFVQRQLQAKNRLMSLQNNINDLNKEITNVLIEIKAKKRALVLEDQKHIINIAKFVICEKPSKMKMLQEKRVELEELTQKLKASKTITTEVILRAEKMPILEDNLPNLSKYDNDKVVMPKLQLLNVDLDSLNFKLDQIKKVDVMNNDPDKKAASIKFSSEGCGNKDKMGELGDRKQVNKFNSAYFNCMEVQHESVNKDFSKRKLIHILNEVNITMAETKDIVSKVDPTKFQNVNVIRANITDDAMNISEENNDVKITKDEDVEVISQVKKLKLLHVPPTQFGDEKQDSNEKSSDKLSSKDSTIAALNELETENIINKEKNEEVQIDTFISSQLDVSTASDEMMKTREAMLRTHKLNISPQFVYAKNDILQKIKEDNVITSKFFDNKKNIHYQEENCENTFGGSKSVSPSEDNTKRPHATIDSNVDVGTVMSNNKFNQDKQKPLTGFLFTHGSQGIIDSLNISASTTDYGDGDADFPDCRDSSILFSPKGDLCMNVASENTAMLSQEVPNFLSGFKKTGSFFGWSSSCDPKPDSSVQNSSTNFNFNFSSEDKKIRGGLFNMFN